MRIGNIRTLTNSINELCFRSIIVCKNLPLNGELQANTSHNLNTMYGLLGLTPNIQLHRGIANWVGTSLKVLFGTMDSYDFEQIKGAMDSIEKN